MAADRGGDTSLCCAAIIHSKKKKKIDLCAESLSCAADKCIKSCIDTFLNGASAVYTAVV